MKLRILPCLAAATFAASLGLMAPASAAVTFDPDTGTGFVGKGDVQTVLGWNDRQLQANADNVDFSATSTTVTEVSWVCTNDRNENTQERQRTTTTETTGVVDTVARTNKNGSVTGFNLTGYQGTPETSSSTEGNPLNSCPSGPWVLTTPAGDPEVISQTSTVNVRYDGNTYPL